MHGRMFRVVAASSLLLGTGASTPAMAGAATPARVTRAQDSVVRVIKASGGERSAAVAIDRRGNFLTTQGAVSRSPIVQVFVRGRKGPLEGRRVQSDAPPGFELIHVEGAPAMRPLTFAPRLPSGNTLWIAAPRTVLARPRHVELLPAEVACSAGSDIVTVETKRVVGMNGSPVVDDSGHVVGLVRRSGLDANCYNNLSVIQVLRARRVPQRLAPSKPPERSDFPAVAVVLGLALALIAANAFFVVRRRRAIPEPILTTPEPAYDDAPPEPNYPAEDDLEIALRPKGSPRRRPTLAGSAVPPDPDDEIGPINLK